MSGRRFLWRWSARLLRREWRQHAVIAALLATGVAVGVGALVAVFNLAAPPGGTYGTGQARASIVGDASGVGAALADQGHPFATIETASAPIQGSAVRPTFRAQDPDDAVAQPLLALVDGRWPAADDEVAVTEGVARRLGLDGSGLGETIRLGSPADDDTDDAALAVVGVVENPTDLDDEFVLAIDLERLGIDRSTITSQFLVDGDPTEIVFPGGVGAISVDSGGSGLPVDTRTALTLLVNLVTLLALLEVVLLAGAGFAVLARRRTRQYGLLGAIGAAPAHVRQAATAGGVLVGIVGSTVGVIVGVGLAALVVPGLEESIGHRIDLTVPWWTVVPTAGLAVAAAALAARWPTRRLADQPVARTLAARRPRSGPVGRLALVGLLLTGAGLVLLLTGVANLSIGPAVAGLALTPIGVLLATPAVVRSVALVGSHLPLAARLAARAIDRQRGRSAAVVAALVVALGVPVGLVAATTSIDRFRASEAPNLEPDMAVAWLPGAEDPVIEIPADLDADAAAGARNRIEAALPSARVVPIEVAVNPDQGRFSVAFDSLGLVPSVMPAFGVIPQTRSCLVCDEFAFGDRDDEGNEILFTGHEAWIATPALLDALALDGSGGRTAEADVGLTREADVRLLDDRLAAGPSGLGVDPAYPEASRIAPVLLWPDVVAERGWEATTIGWLLVDPGVDLVARLDDLVAAGDGDVLIEARSQPSPQTALRVVALLVGGLTGLAVLAAAVALEVAEGADDRRILRAIGAGPRTARRLSASGAALLALIGAGLAVPIGYLALVALLAVPGIELPLVVAWPALALVLVVVPALAWTLGWVGAARTGRTVDASRWNLVPVLALAVASGLVASACSVPGFESGPAGGVDVSVGPAEGEGPDCDPGLDAALASWAEVGFAGAVVVLGGDRPCLAAYGAADPRAGRPNTVDTVFSIGSVTKAVTAAAVLDLIDRGLVTLDDPVGRHRPDLDGPVAELTIRQLLLHTSGLVGEHGVDHRPLDEADAVARIGGLDLGFAPGRQYLYANAGYTLLALVVEAVTDVGFRHHVANEILVDGDGNRFGGFWDGEPAAPGPRAIGFPDGVTPGHLGDFAGPHWGLDGNGGVAMTALDLANWTRRLFAGEVLSERGTELLTSTTTHLGDGVELPGWVRIDRSVLGEELIAASGGGGSIGHSVDVAWLPESERVVVVATNRSTARSGPLIDHIVPALIAGTGIPGPPTFPPVGPAEAAAMTGRWVVTSGGSSSAEADGTLVVETEDGGLRVGADGPAAVALLFPTPPAMVAEVAEHERLALAFVDGQTSEGRRWREEIEAANGAIEEVEVDGTLFDGELVTRLRIQTGPDPVADRHTASLVLNRYGGSEAIGFDDSPLSIWLVGDGTGGYRPFLASPDRPSVTLRPSPDRPVGDDRLIVEGPDGIVELERVGR